MAQPNGRGTEILNEPEQAKPGERRQWASFLSGGMFDWIYRAINVLLNVFVYLQLTVSVLAVLAVLVTSMQVTLHV